MRETLAHYIFMFLRVIPTLDLASAYVDEGGFYGGIFCWNATLSDLFDVVKKKYMLSLFFSLKKKKKNVRGDSFNV